MVGGYLYVQMILMHGGSRNENDIIGLTEHGCVPQLHPKIDRHPKHPLPIHLFPPPVPCAHCAHQWRYISTLFMPFFPAQNSARHDATAQIQFWQLFPALLTTVYMFCPYHSKHP